MKTKINGNLKILHFKATGYDSDYKVLITNNVHDKITNADNGGYSYPDGIFLWHESSIMKMKYMQVFSNRRNFADENIEVYSNNLEIFIVDGNYKNGNYKKNEECCYNTGFKTIIKAIKIIWKLQ